MAVTWTLRCLLWGCWSGFVSVYIIRNWLISSDNTPWIVAAMSGVAVLCGISSAIAFHISTLHCSETHTLKTLLLQYFIMKAVDIIAPFANGKLSKVWKNPMLEQEKFLKTVLARDADTEYGRRHGFHEITSLQEFREKHPLTTYDYFRDYFKRLADGEKNVCVAGNVEWFGITCATTGEGKLIPMLGPPVVVFLMFTIPRVLTTISPVQRACFLYSKPSDMFTKTGRPIAPAVVVPKGAGFFFSAVQNTPISGFQIEQDFEATYVHVLFALADKNLFQFIAPFASQVYRAFKMIEEQQHMFLEDLTKGQVNPTLKIDQAIRRSLDKALTSDPARADELRVEFSKGFVGIVGRIWPNLTCVSTIDISGYMERLDAGYTKGTKLYTSAYGCTEGTVGINPWIDQTLQQNYVLMPHNMVVEFIHEDHCDEENPSTLLTDEVEVGTRYEIVLTTRGGLYRYRIGDMVDVVGFREKCPVVSIAYRKGDVLSIRGERMHVLLVKNAVMECLAGWTGASLVEWTCAGSALLFDPEDRDIGKSMFHMLFAELDSNTKVRLSDAQKALFDEGLRKQHPYYDYLRRINAASEARVFVVRPGSFQKLKEYMIATSTATYNQFKMPKKLRTKATLELMLGSVIDPESLETLTN